MVRPLGIQWFKSYWRTGAVMDNNLPGKPSVSNPGVSDNLLLWQQWQTSSVWVCPFWNPIWCSKNLICILLSGAKHRLVDRLRDSDHYYIPLLQWAEPTREPTQTDTTPSSHCLSLDLCLCILCIILPSKCQRAKTAGFKTTIGPLQSLRRILIRGSNYQRLQRVKAIHKPHSVLDRFGT